MFLILIRKEIEHAGAAGAEGGQRARAAASDSMAIPFTRSNENTAKVFFY